MFTSRTYPSIAGNVRKIGRIVFNLNYNSKKIEKLLQITPGGSFNQVALETMHYNVCMGFSLRWQCLNYLFKEIAGQFRMPATKCISIKEPLHSRLLASL